MSDKSETSYNDAVQMPLRMCNLHDLEELVVFCKTCWTPVCVPCSREGHLEHDCEGLAKVARDVRRQIPETCRKIERESIEKMKMELQNLQSKQVKNRMEYVKDKDRLEEMQCQLIGTVQSFFERRRSECQKRLNVLNGELEERERGLMQKISTLEQRIKLHEKSMLIYGNYDVIETDTELKNMVEEYQSVGFIQRNYERMNMSSLKYQLSDFMNTATSNS